MGVKKSQLYSSLWSSCDELRGGMDASQYKDYVLVMLFVKYVSDKYDGQPFAPIVLPKGACFKDMVALKGKTSIGDDLNKLIIGPLFKANDLSTPPDFNDPTKLGSGKEMVERLTNLIAIFENPALDFSQNRADGDDILGDAYEYLMRHFATESGKSKGQFYTPAEVSRVMAKIVGIREAKTSRMTTVYDPTCGSGSLLLKVGHEAQTRVSLYGQEKDSATAGLARMNMILHNEPTADIKQGNTLAKPLFLDKGGLKTFDFAVANPPFSDKRWSTGFDPDEDDHGRFKHYGVPPAKQGDYAYLLHIIRSLKSGGKGACILPHGVLFRGNAEAEIRRNLIRRGLIKGIIGLPANLFYGTGIPACIVLIDKEGATSRRSIFMVDASRGFLKDGNKNRLREMDIHRIVDVFTNEIEADPKYARRVPIEEIEKNGFNLNIPRYIDGQEAEDLQDIDAHLRGGIPVRDVDALDRYWSVCPKLRSALFKERRPGYVDLTVGKSALKATVLEHPEFTAFTGRMEALFEGWRAEAEARLKALAPGFAPKALIDELGESILAHYEGAPLVDAYAVYQHLLDYWSETMQDDVYLLADPDHGWKAEPYRVMETAKTGKKKGKQVDKGWACDLVPKDLLIKRYFWAEAAAIEEMRAELESATAARAELEEEHGGEDGLFAELEKINNAEINRRLKEIKGDDEALEEQAALNAWKETASAESAAKKVIKVAETELDDQALAKYSELSEDDIKELVVDDKWLATLSERIHGELDRVNQALAQRVKALAERYETTLPEATERVAAMQEKVNRHLERMGFAL